MRCHTLLGTSSLEEHTHEVVGCFHPGAKFNENDKGADSATESAPERLNAPTSRLESRPQKLKGSEKGYMVVDGLIYHDKDSTISPEQQAPWTDVFVSPNHTGKDVTGFEE